MYLNITKYKILYLYLMTIIIILNNYISCVLCTYNDLINIQYYYEIHIKIKY